MTANDATPDGGKTLANSTDDDLKVHAVERGHTVAIVRTARGLTPAGTYRFAAVAQERVVGEIPGDGTVAVVPIDGAATPPLNVQPTDDLPAVVVESVAEGIGPVLGGVTSTWAEWNGRPEFSEAEIDVTDAYVVDL